jgi:hypothetical protein
MTGYEKSQNAWIIGGFVLISTICVSPMLFFGKTLILRGTFFEFRFFICFFQRKSSKRNQPPLEPLLKLRSAFYYFIFFLICFTLAFMIALGN